MQRDRWTRLAVELILIFASVMAAFALSEWRDQRSIVARVTTAIASCRQEMAENLAELEEVHPLHREVMTALDRARAQGGHRSIVDVMAAVMPEQGLRLSPPSDAAWDAAVSTGAVADMPYGIARALAEVYMVQRSGVAETTRRISDRFFSSPTFDPAGLETTLMLLSALMAELVSQEEYLIGLYRDRIAVLTSGPAVGTPGSG